MNLKCVAVNTSAHAAHSVKDLHFISIRHDIFFSNE